MMNTMMARQIIFVLRTMLPFQKIFLSSHLQISHLLFPIDPLPYLFPSDAPVSSVKPIQVYHQREKFLMYSNLLVLLTLTAHNDSSQGILFIPKKAISCMLLLLHIRFFLCSFLRNQTHFLNLSPTRKRLPFIIVINKSHS